MHPDESTKNPGRCDGIHDFSLEYYVDDRHSPTEITISSTESIGSLATEWITADIDDAVPFESIP